MKAYRVTFLKSASYQVSAENEEEARNSALDILVNDGMAWQDEPYETEIEDISK